jgi:trimeric autotransporter adhesin
MNTPITYDGFLITVLRWRATILLFALRSSALCHLAHAVSPPPDGGYPGGNTAEGQSALFSLTTGGFNTAVGFLSLRSNTTGSFSTAIGAGALLANTADQNTATGAAALFSNTIGDLNTANGAFALFSNTTGGGNTANGFRALFSNTEGSDNTANGFNALISNTTGEKNTANGRNALFSDTEGAHNTADGFNALGFTTTGSSNTAIGDRAGADQTTGSGNVYIGAGMQGVTGENNACYIASIFGQTSSAGTPVLINSNNKLGTMTSSKRFKQEIKPMDKASEAVLALKPVIFRYNRQIDPAGTAQFGLVAEDVERVNSDLVVRDNEGRPYSVRYDAVNAMLLNEFLKEHRKVQELEATVTEQKRGMDVLTTQVEKQAVQIQEVSAQLAAASRSGGGLKVIGSASEVVLNSP